MRHGNAIASLSCCLFFAAMSLIDLHFVLFILRKPAANPSPTDSRNLLGALTEKQPSWERLKATAAELDLSLIPFDSHAETLEQIKVLLIGHFPPSTNIVEILIRLLWLNDKGEIGEPCWRVVFNLFEQILTEVYGVPPGRYHKLFDMCSVLKKYLY